MPAPPTVPRRTVLGALAVGGPLILLGCGADDETPIVESGADGGRPQPLSDDTLVLSYGPGPHRYGHLDLPPGDRPAAGWPVAVLIHGGFWRVGYEVELMFGLSRSLVGAGWATWNIQYSSVGDREGGWPGTFLDVAAAIDHLDVIDEAALDRSRVLAVGHSAGGHLALWAATRPGLPEGAPGAGPAVPVTAAVSQAGVTDLLACVDDDLGGGACPELMGVLPREDLGRYVLASPIERLPSGVPTMLVHGERDDVVPVEQSRRFVDRARAAGEDPVLVTLEDADHFAPIDPDHEAWRRVLDQLPALTA